MRLFLIALCGATLLSVSAGPGMAQRHDRHDSLRHDNFRHDTWRGDIGRFRDHDFNRWRGGNWYHGDHLGRLGWWWIVGNGWYYYPRPIYPYPNPYTPPVIVAPQPHYWYYCGNPPGYYPYVPQCLMPWQPVPAR